MTDQPFGPEEFKDAAQGFLVTGETGRWGKPKVATIEDLRVLGQDNDPFYCGSPRHWQWARWFAGMWDSYADAAVQRRHLRSVHYRLFTLDSRASTGNAEPLRSQDGTREFEVVPIELPDGTRYADAGPRPPGHTDEQERRRRQEHVQRSWQKMVGASRWARYLGLVDPERLDDRRSDPARINDEDEIPGEPGVELLDDYDGRGDLPEISLPLHTWAVPAPARFEADEAEDPDVPAVWVTGYRDVQDPLLELWIEKSTQDDILDPLCRDLQVNYLRGMGYLSITRVIELLRRAEQLGRDIHVFYVSDLDRAGGIMPSQVSRQAEFWRQRLGIAQRVTLEQVALTEEQVTRFSLPPSPDSDAVELDALEVIVPGELARMVREAVARWRDSDLPDAAAAAERDAQEAASEQWDEETEALREDAAEITAEFNEAMDAYRERLAPLADESAEALAPVAEAMEAANTRLRPLCDRYRPVLAEAHAERDRFQDRLDEVRARVEPEFEQAEFDLPEVPAAEPDPDYDAVLFDSDRWWLDQLNVFREVAEWPLLQVRRAVDEAPRLTYTGPVPTGPGPERTALVGRLRAERWTLDEIADLLGISPTRVAQLAREASA